jgi:hypothetical protein
VLASDMNTGLWTFRVKGGGDGGDEDDEDDENDDD